MGFPRRFQSNPGLDTLAQIEGVAIIDLPPPAAISGVPTGVVGMVGEFPDLTYATQVDQNANVTTKHRPVRVFSTAELLASLGGFEPELGDFGSSNGNGWAAVSGKRFGGLVIVPVNLSSPKATRAWRELPTNTAPGNPTPVVPMAPATVAAGHEFRTGQNRVRLGKPVQFAGDEAYLSGTDGNVLAVIGAATAGKVTSGAGPFDFRGLAAPNILMAFDTGGDQMFSITAAAAIAAGAGATYPVTATIGLSVNGGPAQTISVVAAADAAGLASQINAQIFDASAVVNGTNVDIRSDRKGSSASINITLVTNTTNVSGFSTGLFSGSGNVANDAAVTATELAAFIDGPLTNGTATVVDGNKLRFTSDTLGVLSSAQVKAASTADGAMGGEFATNTIGAGTASGPGTATPLAFTSATADFVGNAVKEGDILVAGVIGGVGAEGTNAGTYRVFSVNSSTEISVEKLDGTAFTWATTGSLTWRIHAAKVADSGDDHKLSESAGYTLPVRNLDAVIAASTTLTPTEPAAAATASTWDPLSGLRLRTDPVTGLTYVPAVQAPNPVASATLDALYADAIAAFKGDDLPQRDVSVIFSARTSASIRSALRAHALDVSAVGVGRVAVVSPPVDSLTLAAASGDASPGAGATRDERVIYCWPNAQVRVNEAVGARIKGSDGAFHEDGLLDVGADASMASVLSNLNPELNPGREAEPIQTILAHVSALARGSPSLGMNEYIALKQRGVAGLKFQRNIGSFVFQSGITSSLVDGRRTVARRRFADFVQDSVQQALASYAKQPVTEAWKAAIEGSVRDFMDGLKSETNPAAQRIRDYSVDVVSGNTAATVARGIYVLILKVQMLADAAVLVVQTEIGETVEITEA